MGIAAYNRGTKCLCQQIDREQRPMEFALMDEFNALPRLPGAQRPFGPVQFVASHGGWWTECPVTGYGYWYRTLRQAIRSWKVSIVGYRNGIWEAIPD